MNKDKITKRIDEYLNDEMVAGFYRHGQVYITTKRESLEELIYELTNEV